MQPLLRKIPLLQLLILAAAIPLFHYWTIRLPDRAEVGARASEIVYTPVSLASEGFAPLRLAGAWKLVSEDPRWGGISALAVDGGDLLALTDSGVLARFPKPPATRATARIRELPDGPGDPRFKRNRDAEALTRDPAGRGWWVAFENRNELWLYDDGFSRPLGRIAFGRGRWPVNRGIEALAPGDQGLVAFAEKGREWIRVTGTRIETFPLATRYGYISEAARAPDRRLFLVARKMALAGIAKRLLVAEGDAASLHLRSVARLELGALDNVEAMAAERLTTGQLRLWLMTDNDFQRRRRTLLVALDVPPAL